jgi:hypothetical protein
MSEDQIIMDFENHSGIYTLYCAFNSKNELILYNGTYNGDWDHINYIICIYSLQSKNNKFIYKCKRMYWTTGNVISIQKDDKVYLSSSSSNNSVYEFNLITEETIKIVGSSKKLTPPNDIKEVIKISETYLKIL